MGVYSSKFKIGDLVVGRYSDFDDFLAICKVVSIEYIDELNEMWVDGYDTEPYYLYETEVTYLKQDEDGLLELGDKVCFEDKDAISLMEYMARPITLDDYIDYQYNGKELYGE